MYFKNILSFQWIHRDSYIYFHSPADTAFIPIRRIPWFTTKKSFWKEVGKTAAIEVIHYNKVFMICHVWVRITDFFQLYAY